MGEWWRGAVVYQVYPRSFQDDNGDGVGDLKGITRRLPHVAQLGCDAVWLSPFFTSPMRDMGYDVSDYRDVDPVFGTLADFDDLIATGGTARAALRLLRKAGGVVTQAQFVVDLPDLGGADRLCDEGIAVHALVDFPGD